MDGSLKLAIEVAVAGATVDATRPTLNNFITSFHCSRECKASLVSKTPAGHANQ